MTVALLLLLAVQMLKVLPKIVGYSGAMPAESRMAVQSQGLRCVGMLIHLVLSRVSAYFVRFGCFLAVGTHVVFFRCLLRL